MTNPRDDDSSGTPEPFEELGRQLRVDLARFLRGRFTTRSLDFYDLGYIDGLLDAHARIPGTAEPARTLWQVARAAHRHLIRGNTRCWCGLAPECGPAETGVLAQVVDELTTIVRDDLGSCRAALDGIAARRAAFESGTYDREELQHRVLAILTRVRHELPAKEIAQRIGQGVTGQQVGGALRSLEDQELVVGIEYQHPRTGHATLHWQAAQFYADEASES